LQVAILVQPWRVNPAMYQKEPVDIYEYEYKISKNLPFNGTFNGSP